jgi:hypothetical protein
MTVEREGVTREEVIRFYVRYDWPKKKPKDVEPPDLEKWPWDDPNGIDQKLRDNGLKEGVLAAYRTWTFREFNIKDLLKCAVFNQIFPTDPQALSRLVLLGKLAEWFPIGAPEWWRLIGNGSDLGVESALIARKAVRSEAPADWYIEDGSGRALALLQRILRYGETGRTAWVYLGHEPDERSKFMTEHPELTR